MDKYILVNPTFLYNIIATLAILAIVYIALKAIETIVTTLASVYKAATFKKLTEKKLKQATDEAMKVLVTAPHEHFQTNGHRAGEKIEKGDMIYMNKDDHKFYKVTIEPTATKAYVDKVATKKTAVKRKPAVRKLIIKSKKTK